MFNLNVLRENKCEEGKNTRDGNVQGMSSLWNYRRLRKFREQSLIDTLNLVYVCA